jgi:hypothetical protein
MSYGSWVNRKQVIGKQVTENKEKKSCHSIWLLTTCPTTSTRPP